MNNETVDSYGHETVFLAELVEVLGLKRGDLAVDCTSGGGGHTQLLLEKVGHEGRVIAIDQDPNAIDFLKQKFSSAVAVENLLVRQSKFSRISDIIKDLGLENRINGIIADLGVSSPQLDREDRGFSFMNDGPLDMRMNPADGGMSAKDVVSSLSLDELKKIFADLGEEPKAYYAARAIVEARGKSEINTTFQLAEVVKKAIHYKTVSRKHPATRVFQALRMYVNDELGELEKLLNAGFELLKPGGTLAIISFHSLEDRMIKQSFKKIAGKGRESAIDASLPFTEEERISRLDIRGEIGKPFPMVPSEDEIRRNPRARSAKLRFLRKIR